MFEKLLAPGKIGNLKLKNRIIKAPQHTGLANPDGSVTDRLIRHYKEQAMGGAGLIIVEYAYIDNDASKASPCQLSINNIETIAGLSLLAHTIRANGAKAAIQIAHGGRQKFTFSRPIKAPSTVPWEEMHFMGCPPPDELTFEEIQQIVVNFGEAAKRALTADFDMVEIHAAHGYLISNFLSPRTNKRTDWYGGSFENRMRFLMEVMQEVMSQVGPQFPVSVRLSGIDYEPDGTTIEESIEISKRLEAMGVAVIHVSGGNHHQTIHEVSPMSMSLAHNIWAAQAVKKEITIPVIGSGSITTPELAENILNEKKADFLSFGRPLWADPEMPRKIKAGKPEDVRPCIRCNDGCLARGDHLARTVACTVNVALGREAEFKIEKTQAPRNIAVIGGGPAGMEAARVCALKGHRVTLYEKRRLGGVLLEGSVPDFKADIKGLIRYLSTQMETLDITVKMEKADVQEILDNGFDAAIVACGARPFIPDVPGIDDNRVVNAIDVLAGSVETGQKIAVIGAGVVGVEVGLFLGEKGKEIDFYEMTDSVMAGATPDERQVYENRLADCKASFHTGQRLDSITKDQLLFVDRYGNQTRAAAETIILACGLVPDTGLYDALENTGKIDVFEAGDCVTPRKILDAVREGHIAAKLIA